NSSPASTDPLAVVLGDTDGTPVYVSGDTNSDGLLERGETWVYTLTVTLPVGNAYSSHVNTVTATGTDDEGDVATAYASATVAYTDVPPAITVTKAASVSSVEEGGVGNQSVTYTYEVTNSSLASTDPLTVVLGDTD